MKTFALGLTIASLEHQRQAANLDLAAARRSAALAQAECDALSERLGTLTREQQHELITAAFGTKSTVDNAVHALGVVVNMLEEAIRWTQRAQSLPVTYTFPAYEVVSECDACTYPVIDSGAPNTNPICACDVALDMQAAVNVA